MPADTNADLGSAENDLLDPAEVDIDDEDEDVTDDDASADDAADEDESEESDEDEGDDDDEDGEEADDPSADDEPDAPAEAEKPAPAAQEPAKDESDVILPPPPVAFTDADQARQAAIGKEKDDLFAAFDEGNLTKDEFREKLGALEKEAHTLTAKEGAWGEYAESSGKAWDEAQTKWLAAHPEVTGLSDDHLSRFDSLLKFYTGSGLGDGQSVKAQHDAALKMFAERFPDALPKPKAPAKADTRHPADKRRAAAKPEPVPSLAAMPAAEHTDASDGGEFAYLDRLEARNYEAYEDAVAKLTPAQERRYMARK